MNLLVQRKTASVKESQIIKFKLFVQDCFKSAPIDALNAFPLNL
jgi:hypothetical protein